MVLKTVNIVISISKKQIFRNISSLLQDANISLEGANIIEKKIY
jgi:hypothetical protein